MRSWQATVVSAFAALDMETMVVVDEVYGFRGDFKLAAAKTHDGYHVYVPAAERRIGRAHRNLRSLLKDIEDRGGRQPVTAQGRTVTGADIEKYQALVTAARRSRKAEAAEDALKIMLAAYLPADWLCEETFDVVTADGAVFTACVISIAGRETCHWQITRKHGDEGGWVTIWIDEGTRHAAKAAAMAALAAGIRRCEDVEIEDPDRRWVQRWIEVS
jgi:hypothetical protein